MIRKLILGSLTSVALLLLAVIILYWTPDLSVAELEAKYINDSSAFAKLPSGARAHYRLYGPEDGKKLVLLHGSNASLHTWEPWIAELKNSLRILTIDLPGHGLTGPIPSGDYSPSSMAAMVKELVDYLDWDSFALGGNSMGGGVSLTFALANPDQITHLIPVDASGVTPDTNDGPKSRPLAFKLAGTWYGDLILTNITPRSLAEEGLKASTTVHSIITQEMVTRYHDLARYPGARAATSKRFQLYRQKREDIDVARIASPALLIWGRDDGLISVAAGEKMAKLMPNAKLHVLEETGHLPMEERPRVSASLVRSFLLEGRP